MVSKWNLWGVAVWVATLALAATIILVDLNLIQRVCIAALVVGDTLVIVRNDALWRRQVAGKAHNG